MAPVIVGGLLAQACGQSILDSSEAEPIAAREGAIRGGIADAKHTAVMALLRLDALREGDTAGSCTGTTIARRGDSGILLTAAHCVVETQAGAAVTAPIKVRDPATLGVLPGDDWLVSYDARRIFPVVESAVHPQYDGVAKGEFDVAVIRYIGATVEQPVIPLLSPEEDQLTVGSHVTLVGYGDADGTNSNTERRQIDKVIGALTPTEIRYDQTDGTGTCGGDSGGPVLTTSANGDRLAAMTTFGDAGCATFGVAVRATVALALIQDLTERIPVTPSCKECRLASVAPDQRCAAANAACATSYGPCGLFVACSDLCTDQICIEHCRENYAVGAASYDALRVCECEDSCLTICESDPECQAAPPIAPGQKATPGGGAFQCAVTGDGSRTDTLGAMLMAIAIAIHTVLRRSGRRPTAVATK